MLVRNFLLKLSLLCLIGFNVPALAAPAISDTNMSISGDWTTFGTGGNTNVIFGSSDTNVMGGAVGGFIQSTGGPGSSGTGVANLTTTLTGLNGGPLGAAFTDQILFSSAAKLTGALQTFATGATGDLSFDLQTFVRRNDPTYNGDPFAFVYNLDTNTGTFLRGGALGTGSTAPNITDFTLSGVTYTHGNAASSYTFSNLVAGNYVFGFGFGSDGNAGGDGEFGALAITNINSPDAVPEIDTSTASLPLALILLALAVVHDRKKAIA